MKTPKLIFSESMFFFKDESGISHDVVFYYGNGRLKADVSINSDHIDTRMFPNGSRPNRTSALNAINSVYEDYETKISEALNKKHY